MIYRIVHVRSDTREGYIGEQLSTENPLCMHWRPVTRCWPWLWITRMIMWRMRHTPEQRKVVMEWNEFGLPVSDQTASPIPSSRKCGSKTA